MSDDRAPFDPEDLGDLRAALRAATPRPEAARKTADLRQAGEIFDRLHEGSQGSSDPARPSQASRPVGGRLRLGVQKMIQRLTPMKSALVAGTALVAVGLAMMTPEVSRLLSPPGALQTGGLTGMGDDDGTALRNVPLPEPAPAPPPMADSAEMAQEAPQAPSPKRAVPQGGLMTLNGGGSAASPQVAPQSLKRPETFATRQLDPAPVPEADTEAFSNADDSPIHVTAEDPVSTFSIDVDTAAWGVIRSSLSAGQMPPKDAVRVEEMVNYFPYDYPAPTGGQPFQPTVTVMDTPWNPGTQLVHIALQGELPAIADRPPLNLVFLIDTSGSMQDPDKLPLLVQSLKMMLTELRPDDEIAIVTYAGSAGEVLAPTRASEKSKIIAALDNLTAGGSTAGQAGLEQAYAVAAAMGGKGEVSRILLATDGDFNVGLSDPAALTDYVEKKREGGTYLSVLGFGRGNLDDATMQALAQNGNGTAAYIDTLNEARKVLVDELTGALFPIADDVKIQVEFNPATIAEYRLIGYETRALRREDFANDRVDAGEIGAGTQVTAIYEVTPVGSPAVLNKPLRYEVPEPTRGNPDELGFLHLRYKAPGEDTSKLIETPIPMETTQGGDDQRFAAAIAGFGQLLRGSDYLNAWTYADAIALASGARGEDAFGYRTEAVQMMRLAESLSKP